MKYKCCANLLHHLVFAQADVMVCCCSPTQIFDIKFFNQQEETTFNIEKYIEKRNYFIDMFKRGEIPNNCICCPMIEKKEWDENICLTNIIITNRTKCSCNCIYCSLLEGNPAKKKELNTRIPYDIKPILKEMKKNNFIKPGCNIMIAGGEPAEYPDKELDWLLAFGIELGCSLEVLSSGIIFSNAVENALKIAPVRLRISPDSGNKETYEKIKGVKAFNRVWNNIKKYIKASKHNPKGQVELKYIILPGINDNLKEAKTFIDKCHSVGCNIIEVTIEYHWLNQNKGNPVNEKLAEVVKYFVDLNSKNNEKFEVRFEPQVEYWFKNNI